MNSTDIGGIENSVILTSRGSFRLLSKHHLIRFTWKRISDTAKLIIEHIILKGCDSNVEVFYLHFLKVVIIETTNLH